MKIKRLLYVTTCFYLCLLLGTNSCSSQRDSNNSNLSFKDRIKLRQYLIQGEDLYLAHCANCHQPDGTGLGKLIPPLSGNNHFTNDLGYTICSIRNGLEGPIEIDGIEYDGKMPANYDLTNLEIAEITTYTINNWSNKQQIVTVSTVEKQLDSCSVRSN